MVGMQRRLFLIKHLIDFMNSCRTRTNERRYYSLRRERSMQNAAPKLGDWANSK